MVHSFPTPFPPKSPTFPSSLKSFSRLWLTAIPRARMPTSVSVGPPNLYLLLR